MSVKSSLDVHLDNIDVNCGEASSITMTLMTHCVKRDLDMRSFRQDMN